jgi:hypothetical protein
MVPRKGLVFLLCRCRYRYAGFVCMVRYRYGPADDIRTDPARALSWWMRADCVAGRVEFFIFSFLFSSVCGEWDDCAPGSERGSEKAVVCPKKPHREKAEEETAQIGQQAQDAQDAQGAQSGLMQGRAQRSGLFCELCAGLVRIRSWDRWAGVER